MIRRKHNLRQTLHLPLEIHYRKADSAYITCSCGYRDLVGTWYSARAMHRKTGIRTERQWGALLDAVRLFLEAATLAREGE